jgi:conjugal transfer/entry exclusion protein
MPSTTLIASDDTVCSPDQEVEMKHATWAVAAAVALGGLGAAGCGTSDVNNAKDQINSVKQQAIDAKKQLDEAQKKAEQVQKQAQQAENNVNKKSGGY